MVLAGGTIPDLLDSVNPYVNYPSVLNLEEKESQSNQSNIDLSGDYWSNVSNVFNPSISTNLGSIFTSSEHTANEVNDSYSNGENAQQPRDYLEEMTGIFQKMLASANQQNALAYQNAFDTRKFNAEQAEITRNWEKMMRDTQISSTIKQLADAGVNPLLAIQGSLGYANASSGASASSSNTSFGNDNSIISAIIAACALLLGSGMKSLGGLGKLIEVLG